MLDTAADPKPGSDGDGVTGDEDGRVGLHKQSPEVQCKQFLAWWKESADGSVDRRELAKKCHKMFDSDQWENDDLQLAKQQKRPALTLNMVLSIVSAVEGQERNNRQEMRFYGRGKEDDTSAAKYNDLLKWVIDQNEGEYELSQQFHEMIIAGQGWVVPEVDYFEDPEGQLTLSYVDDDEVFDDPLGKCPVGSDSRFLIRCKMMTEDEGEAMWPDKFIKATKLACVDNNVTETDGSGYPDIYLTPDTGKGPKHYDKTNKTWAVLECWWWEIQQGWVVRDGPDGLLEEMTDEELEEAEERRRQEQIDALNELLMRRQAGIEQPMAMPGVMGASALPQVMVPPALEKERRPVKKIYQGFSVYDRVLEVEQSPLKLKRFPYVPLRGIRRKTKKDWIGIVQPIIDPQRQMNVEQSVIVQLMQLMPKQSWMGPRGSFHNKQDWENKLARPGQMLEYNNKRGKPEPIPVQGLPRHIVDMAFTRPQSMREISGVNVELTGQRVASDPGVVMEMRAKAAQTVLAPIFDNARRSKKVLGKVLVAYIQAFLSPGRQIRILGPEGAQHVDVTEDMLTGRYDLQVDESDSTVNDRMATLNIMQTTLPQIMKAGVPIPPEFVDLLPIEPHIKQEWKRLVHWQMQIQGLLPPPGWQPGMPVPPPQVGGAVPPSGEEPQV